MCPNNKRNMMVLCKHGYCAVCLAFQSMGATTRVNLGRAMWGIQTQLCILLYKKSYFFVEMPSFPIVL